MHFLELKIPPPVIMALTAVAMWTIAFFTSAIRVAVPLRSVAAALIVLTGAVISIAGVVAFRRVRTTVNPMKPESTSALVCSGVYRRTRNPMYVGMLLILVAWAIRLSSPFALLGPVAFAIYMTRFQIGPEERVLSAIFGPEYSAYKSAVRRWL